MNKIILESVDSTNYYAKLNAETFKNDTLIIAKIQTNGHGRKDRVWLSSSEDLCMTLVFINSSEAHHIIAPLTLVYVLEHYGVEAEIKWPNDILINKLKVAGILIEKIVKNKKNYDIVGVGVNFVSKTLESNFLSKFNIKKEEFTNKFVEMYNNLKTIKIYDLLEFYKEHSFILNKYIKYKNKELQVVNFTENAGLVLDDNTILNLNEIDIKSLIIS